jgi:hypothetical protein
MIKHSASHLDHGLTDAQVAYLLERFADRRAFFIETIELPEELGTVGCGLYGPIMGDVPVTEAQVAYRTRGDRAYTSRMLVDTLPRQSRQVTVIAGPHEEHACIVYTAFGGPLAPQEPGDPGCKDVAASTAFWNEHALT